VYKKILFFWILLLPTQLTKFFWPDWSVFLGTRIDFLAPVLYAQDFLIVPLLVLNFSKIILKIKRNKKSFGLLLVLIGLNVVFAIRPEIAIFKWISVLKIIFIAFLVWKDKELVKKYLLFCIPCWVVGELILSLGQVARGGSLQGLFYWLGERKFSYIDPGIALMSIADETFIRAYGTFSHPNVMAGFVGVCLLVWQRFKKIDLSFWLIWWSGIVVLVLTGSRVAILSLLVSLFFKFRIKNILALVVVGLMGLVLYKQVGWDVNSGLKRTWLVGQSLRQIAFSPIFGIGLGNNIIANSEYRNFEGVRLLQPVHNVYLLIMAELGLLVTVIFVFFSKKVRFNKVLLFILITGLFDHYWISAAQTIGLMAVILPILNDKTDTF